MGDSSKAQVELGWERKVDFKGLVSMMVDADMRKIVGIGSEEFRAQREVAVTK